MTERDVTRQQRDATTRLQTWDRQHVWHPFTPMQEYAAEATPVIAAAEGFELIDTDGNRYLDGTSSLWCNVHGHRVPELDAAMQSQIGQVAHSTLLGLGNVPSIQLARALAERAPRGLEHVFYSDDGSTAVEAALKIVYQSQVLRGADPDRKKLFVCLDGGYHGDTIGAVSVGGIPAFHATFGRLLFPALRVPAPVTLRRPGNCSPADWLAHCDRELERTLRERQAEICGVIVEPLVQGASGMLVHPPGYLRRVRTLTAELGLPLIADEVFTGFGRTGPLFACEHEQVVPDLLCISKGLTGGYLPLAATLVNEAYYAPFLDAPSAGSTFYHGHTFTGNPLGCAVALASLQLFEEQKIPENVARIEQVLRSWGEEWGRLPTVAEVRQRGAILAVELVQDRRTLEPFPAARRVGHRWALAARSRGVIVRPIGDILLVIPAPGMPADLVQRICEVSDEALREILPA